MSRGDSDEQERGGTTLIGKSLAYLTYWGMCTGNGPPPTRFGESNSGDGNRRVLPRLSIRMIFGGSSGGLEHEETAVTVRRWRESDASKLRPPVAQAIWRGQIPSRLVSELTRLGGCGTGLQNRSLSAERSVPKQGWQNSSKPGSAVRLVERRRCPERRKPAALVRSWR
jgi:hypothetical protein